MPSDRLVGFLATLGIAVLAGLLRIWQVTEPKGVYFDEVYYTKDAYGLKTYGYEASGDACDGSPAFVVHPPFGKWLMAASQALFGYVDCAGKAHGNPELGWRLSSVVAGTLAVFVLARTARRMFRSTLLGCFAGLLMAFDGLEFVQSRIGILDIFLMTGLVLALACLVLDRDHGRAKLAARVCGKPAPEEGAAGAPGRGEPPSPRFPLARVWHTIRGPDDRYGPGVGLRPWRVACGVFLGLALGVKWSALYTVVGFAALALAWDVGARRTAGVPAPVRGVLRRDSSGAALALVAVPVVVFLGTWAGWFLTDGGWDRHKYGNGLPAAWHGWWDYQMGILDFHSHLDERHPYQSTPLSWLVLARPVAYYYKSRPFGEGGCGAAGGCSQEVLALGNPAIWWVGTLALLVMLGLWVSRRDWRAALVLVGFGSSFLPWLAFPNRTMFFFYAMPVLPFLVLGLTATAGLVLGPRDGSDTRRLIGALTVGVYAIVVVLMFVYFYPILAADVIPSSEWRARMWFPGWI